jgi:hypothetical protein
MEAVFSILGQVVTVLLAAHGLALVIVNLTETPKDDEWVAKVYTWIEYLAGIINKDKVKQ